MPPSHPLLAPLELRGRGLEIGALHNPLLTDVDAEVLYVDHASTEEIRAKYADDESVGDIVDVDVVWGDGPLREALDRAIGPDVHVDFVVASHVIEHVPNLLGWLEELATVVKPGGVVALAIPDKRYCFDARRRVSDVSEVIEARLTHRTRPPLGATFDFWTKYDDVDAQALWNGRPPPPAEPLRDEEALERTRAAATDPGYRDVHCWVFTPASFVEVLHRLTSVDLLPHFELRWLQPTAPGSLEFYAHLERIDPALDAATRRARQEAAIATAREDQPQSPAVALDPELSPREVKLVLAKRRLMAELRAVRAKVRRSTTEGADDASVTQPIRSDETSADFWDRVYRDGGTSGTGSIGRLAEFKAEIVNRILDERQVGRVVELGCGDGRQAEMIRYRDYVGLDVSTTAVQLCRQRFEGDPARRFEQYRPEGALPAADLSLSMDVIYHVLDDGTYDRYMSDLFAIAGRFVLIYSNDSDDDSPWDEVRFRRFSDWIARRQPHWGLAERVPQRYPYVEGDDDTSWSDFYLYERA